MGTEFSNASVSYPACNTSKLGKGSKLASVMLPLKLKLTRSNSVIHDTVLLPKSLSRQWAWVSLGWQGETKIASFRPSIKCLYFMVETFS